MKPVRRWSILLAVLSAICFILLLGIAGTLELGIDVAGWEWKSISLFIAGGFFAVAAYVRMTVEMYKITVAKRRRLKQLAFWREYAEALCYEPETR